MTRDSLRYVPSLVVAGLILLAVTFAVEVVLAIAEILITVFLGIVLSVALSPITGWLARRHVPRAVSVLGVYLVVVGVLALFLWYAVPRLTEDFAGFEELQATLEESYRDQADGTWLPPVEDVQEYGETAARRLGPSLATSAFAAITLTLYALTVFVVALFFSTIQSAARDLLLSLLAPKERATAERVLDHLGVRFRRLVVGELIAMTVVGVLTYIGLSLIGVPFAFILAVIAFLTELLPIIGPWIGGGVAVLVALTVGGETALAVVFFFVVLQQIESNGIHPIVQRQQTELPALVILVAILIGGATFGILGALAALPAAVFIQTILTDVVFPWRKAQIERIERAARAPSA